MFSSFVKSQTFWKFPKSPQSRKFRSCLYGFFLASSNLKKTSTYSTLNAKCLILGIWGNLINLVKPSRVNAVCTAVAGNACKACLRDVYLIMFIFKHGKASLFAFNYDEISGNCHVAAAQIFQD